MKIQFMVIFFYNSHKAELLLPNFDYGLISKKFDETILRYCNVYS